MDALAHPTTRGRRGGTALTAIEYVGWLGNACFFSRFAVQWITVERLRTRAAPQLFWLLSLAGSMLLGAFAAWRGTWVLLVGFAVNGFIYALNLRLHGAREGEPPMQLRVALSLAVVAGVALVGAGIASARTVSSDKHVWIGVAMVGQAMWSSRFVVQWLYSERARQSHFPPAFWILSLAGNILLLLYAIHLREPVFIAGLALGPIVQVRNLWLTATPERSAPLPKAER